MIEVRIGGNETSVTSSSQEVLQLKEQPKNAGVS